MQRVKGVAIEDHRATRRGGFLRLRKREGCARSSVAPRLRSLLRLSLASVLVALLLCVGSPAQSSGVQPLITKAGQVHDLGSDFAPNTIW